MSGSKSSVRPTRSSRGLSGSLPPNWASVAPLERDLGEVEALQAWAERGDQGGPSVGWRATQHGAMRKAK